MIQISVKDLTLGYDKNIILKDLSFEVEKGDYLCIVGENGSGKSTLIKTLLKLKAPISGEVLTENSFTLDKIGYLPQQTTTQRDFPASVSEIVMSGFAKQAGMRPFYNSTEKKSALLTMEELGISELKNRCYRELSGGQQQRVLLARALCAASEMLLLDEPVAGLDPIVTSEMYGMIEKLNRKGITIIMVSHDIAAALKYATKILHIGKTCAFFKNKEEYLKSNIGRTFTGSLEDK